MQYVCGNGHEVKSFIYTASIHGKGGQYIYHAYVNGVDRVDNK
jgi:hypothetical protein